VFTLAVFLAIVSIAFGLMAEVVHYREGKGFPIGHIARAFTIPSVEGEGKGRPGTEERVLTAKRP
jgi:hypothetical protein